MDLRQMEHFLAVAEEQQFTRAAAMRRVSQSGLSASIRTLEDELETTLFTRTTRSVELTDAGRALLPHARSMVAQAAAGKDAVVATRGEVVGELRLGAEQCLGVIDIPELLARFYARYPKVRVSFLQAGTLELLDLVRAGELDVAFVASPTDASRSTVNAAITQRVLSTEPMVVLCSPQSAMAKRSRASWGDLADEVYVDFHLSWAMRSINDLAFTDRRIVRDLRFTVNDVHTLLDLVHRQLGIALVPRPIASKSQAEGLVVLPLDGDQPPGWTLSVATAASEADGSLAQRLVEMVA
jgi:DNA-binding transcriptional LysR family regulator